MYRLFVAIDPPDSAKERLMAICYGIPGAKWVDESRMHITLRFIGEVDGGIFRDVSAGLTRVNCEPFELQVTGVDFTAIRRSPGTLHAVIAKSAPLLHLQKKIESTLVRTGVAAESRNYHPQVNLAKLKNAPPDRLAAFLSQNGLLQLEPFLVTEFCLYSSFLSSQKALHQVESVYQLTGSRS